MLIDISPLVSPLTAVWPGDVRFQRTVSMDTNTGSHLTLSSVQSTVHIGAHTDAPNHFGAGQPGAEGMDLEKYWGRCQVVSVRPEARLVEPKHLDGILITEPRVLFKTGSFPDPNQFNEDFAAFSGEMIRWLSNKGVVLVGIDTPSIDLFESKELPAHRATLECSVGILEGIVLDRVSDGIYELSALPLKLEHCDASPVRAVLRPFEDQALER